MSETLDVFNSKFAYDIFMQKYSMNKQETWSDLCKRVVDAVCGQLLNSEDKQQIYEFMYQRWFIPGGRYLAAAGRPYHQVNNCFLFRAEDTREGWADLMQKATTTLMSGGGIGVDYSNLRPKGAPIKRTGGVSSGPLSLMHMVNEAGRHIRMGGERRSAIWGGLNWKHGDIFDFLNCKNWSENLRIMKDMDINFQLPMEGTNISVIYDTEFFIAMENKHHELHKHAKKVWDINCLQAFSTAEPGFSFNFLKDNESLRNACVSGDTEILTIDGYKRIDGLIDQPITIWNGFEWSEVVPKITGYNQPMLKVSLSDGRSLKCTEYHKFHISTDYNGGKEIKEAIDLKIGDKIEKYKFPIIGSLCGSTKYDTDDRYWYTLGFYCADGTSGQDFIRLFEPKFCCEDRLEVLKGSEKEYETFSGVKYKNLSIIPCGKDKNYVPDDNLFIENKLSFLAGLLDGDGCELKEGGAQIGSIDLDFLKKVQKFLSTLGVNSKIALGVAEGYRTLPDGKGGTEKYFCKQSYRLCIGATQIQDLIKLGLSCERLSFNKTPQRDATRFVEIVSIEKIENEDIVYCFNEPKNHTGIFNGIMTGQCSEVTSEDDSDKCNLGTMWINRIPDRDTFERVVKYATKFLLCGGIYSDVPTQKIREVGEVNNRIGLGLGGIHEWLMLRGMDYEVTPELHKWLNVYKYTSDEAAHIYAKELGVPIPKGKRAIAPTGSIGILAESTTGIEPLFCKAYKRRYVKDESWCYQFVVDGAVKRLLDNGVKLEQIKDSFDLTFKQRVKFQADVQQYVDMSISSTCNLPQWRTEKNNEETLKEYSKTLLKYAKKLRGFTCYPDGCRGGQPLTRVDIGEALSQEGKVFEEKEHQCTNGVCGV